MSFNKPLVPKTENMVKEVISNMKQTNHKHLKLKKINL